MTFETRGDRTLFFDLLPLVIRSQAGLRVKLKLFTVPGQVAHDATRKVVLSRADAVVFVADSRRGQAMNNFPRKAPSPQLQYEELWRER